MALVSVELDLVGALAAAGLEALAYDTLRVLRDRPSERIDALVIGERVADPTHGAAHAYRLDPGLGVVVLGEDRAQCERMRAALRFAPLVGKDVTCIEVSSADVVDVIASAAERTRARRRHRELLSAITPRHSGNTPVPTPTVAPGRERFADRLMELAPVAIVAIDAQRRIVTANPFAVAILGRSERALLGLPLGGEALGGDDGGWEALLAASGRDAGEPTRIVRAGPTGDRVLEARAIRFESEEGDGWLVVIDDVNDRAEAEHERATAYRRAEEASRLKDEFIAMISHELRTPLNAIVGWLHLLLHGGLDPDCTAHALAVVDRNAKAQARLIEDLLDISRIVTGKLRLDIAKLSMASVVAAAADAVAPAAVARRVRISFDAEPDLPPVLGDADRLQQVVWNLVSNAVKFTRLGGSVAMSLRAVGSALELTVADDGQGIAPELLPFVFDPFRQADGSTTRAHGGLGLGLAIVRRLVEMHGGTVDAASEGNGKGTVFCVRLPISALAAETTSTEGVGAGTRRSVREGGEGWPSLAGLVILVVDDEADARELLVAVLELAGAVVRAAGSVLEARAVLAEARPAIVISDIGMPGEDGYALVEHVRGAFGADFPLVALTAYAAADARAKALARGFVDHLAKPVEATLLVRTVARLAGR